MKFTKYNRKGPKPEKKLHPIWRGIGCLLIIIMPLISYFTALEIIKVGVSQGWSFPPYFLGFVKFPDWVWKFRVLAVIAGPIANFPNLLAVLAITIVLVIILFGIFSFLYSLLYKVVGPPRYTEIDSPPIKGRRIRRSR